MATNIERRRRIRALEAKRDSLMQNKNKNQAELAKVRAELKTVRAQ
jgi:predicted  nucleic acid-binding Zn-ribbon protein